MRNRCRFFLFLLAAPIVGAQTSAHARQQFDLKNYDVAKQEFAVLAKANPKDVTPVLYLGRIALQNNDVDEAVRQFERCGDLEDRNAECHTWLGNALGEAAQHASKFRQPFLAKRVKKEFERAVELDPNSIDARSGLLTFYMLAPGFMGGNMDKAREQAVEIDRRSKLRGALALGYLADHEKNFEASEAAYSRAIAIAPDSAIGYTALINTYAREKRWSDAFRISDKLITTVPSEVNALLLIPRLAWLSGEQLGRGEEYAKRWIANPPKDAGQNTHSSAHLRLGNVYEKTNRNELARAEYERALQYNSKNDDARKGLDRVK